MITYSFVDPKVQQLIHAGEEALILPSLDLQRNVGDAPVAVGLGLLHRGLQPEPSAEPGAHLLRAACAEAGHPPRRWAFVRM